MLPVFASIVAGIAACLSVWLILSVVTGRRKQYESGHQFEKRRRDLVRRGSFTFRNFEPAVDEIGEMFAVGNEAKLEKLSENILASGAAIPWRAAEFMAAKVLESFVMGLGALAFANLILGYDLFSSIVLAVVFAMGMYWLALSSMERKSNKRRRRIKRDFAAAIDLLALMMGVGGGFLDSLKVVAGEYKGKELGNELATIISDVELGKPRKQALVAFEKRMKDEDISEVVFACNESEELGVPIAKTLEDQADRIRQKRSSWAESAAQEAEVILTFPAMVIMIACMITVGAPFVLSFLQNANFEF